MIIGSNDRQGCHVATEMSDMKQRQAEQSKYHMGKRSQQNLVYSDQAIVFVRNYP